MTHPRWVLATGLSLVVLLVTAALALLAANPDIRAAPSLAVLDQRIVTEPAGVLRVPCLAPDQPGGSAAVALAVRNDGALPVVLGEAETLQGADGPVATVGYRRAGERAARLLVPPGGNAEVILDLVLATCGPGHNEDTTSTIRQVTLPVRSLGIASSVVLELPGEVKVPGLVDITPLNPFGCTVGAGDA